MLQLWGLLCAHKAVWWSGCGPTQLEQTKHCLVLHKQACQVGYAPAFEPACADATAKGSGVPVKMASRGLLVCQQGMCLLGQACLHDTFKMSACLAHCYSGCWRCCCWRRSQTASSWKALRVRMEQQLADKLAQQQADLEEQLAFVQVGPFGMC